MYNRIHEIKRTVPPVFTCTTECLKANEQPAFTCTTESTKANKRPAFTFITESMKPNEPPAFDENFKPCSCLFSFGVPTVALCSPPCK